MIWVVLMIWVVFVFRDVFVIWGVWMILMNGMICEISIMYTMYTMHTIQSVCIYLYMVEHVCIRSRSEAAAQPRLSRGEASA